jgi:hypothetical protein
MDAKFVSFAFIYSLLFAACASDPATECNLNSDDVKIYHVSNPPANAALFRGLALETRFNYRIMRSTTREYWFVAPADKVLFCAADKAVDDDCNSADRWYFKNENGNWTLVDSISTVCID